MKSYIALLRGINVSGKNIIRMTELQNLLASTGFDDVKTYIQSGNIVFRHHEMPLTFFENKIHAAIQNEFGFNVPVVAMDGDYLERIIANNPIQEFDESKLMVTFLAGNPAKEKIDVMMEISYPPDKIFEGEKAFYVYCPDGFGRSKFNNNFFEKKLGQVATGRNWKTCKKLLEMAG